MKQKYFIFNLLLKIWFGILCASLLCTLGITWLTAQSTKPVPNDNLDTTYKGMLLTWSILGVLILSVGSTTLFLNCFAKIRRNSLCSFLSFFYYSNLNALIFRNNVFV